MNSDESAFRHIAWGQCIVIAVGALLLLLGVARFVHAGRFGP